MAENLSVSNLPAIKFDGIYRVLACIPSSPESLEGFKSFSDIRGFALNPAQWKEIDLSHFKNPIWDQRMTSSCVGQGCGAGMQTCRMQAGRKFKEFNPYFIYGLVNGGRDQGAMISDAMRALMKTGVCLKNDIKRGQMYRHQFAPEAFESAKRFKLVDAYKCNSFEDICSAITLGFVVPLGILVDQNFPRVDGEGVSPVASPGRGGGHCVKPETIISGPSMKKAEDIKVGEIVFGHDGRKHKVEEIFKRYYNGNLVKISSGGSTSVTVTEEHPILVYRRSKKGVPIKITAGFVENYDTVPHYKSWQKFETAWVSAKDVKEGDYILTPKLKLGISNETPEWLSENKQAIVPNRLKPSKDLAWLMGYFVGDGSTHNKTFELIFSSKDEDLFQKAKRIINELGLNPKTKVKTDKYIKLRVSSSVLAKSFRKWFGAYAHEKHIPDWLFSGEWDLESLLQGLMDADGCNYKGYNIFSTVSLKLAQQVRLIVAMLGNRPSGNIACRSKGSYKNAKTSYVVKWVNGKQKIIRDTDEFILYPVKSKIFIPYSGHVYNFEVEGCHSYLADTISVHNCILGVGLKKFRRYGWLIKCQNSWGRNFGINGFSYIHRAHFQFMHPDAFAIQTMINEDGEDQSPVVTN